VYPACFPFFQKGHLNKAKKEDRKGGRGGAGDSKKRGKRRETISEFTFETILVANLPLSE